MCSGARPSEVRRSEDFRLRRHELLEFRIVAQTGELGFLSEFLALLETLFESLADVDDCIRVAARLGIGPGEIVMKFRTIADASFLNGRASGTVALKNLGVESEGVLVGLGSRFEILPRKI